MKSKRPWLFFPMLCLASAFVAMSLRDGTDATPFVHLWSLVEDIEDWIDKKIAVADIPDTESQAASETTQKNLLKELTKPPHLVIMQLEITRPATGRTQNL